MEKDFIRNGFVVVLLVSLFLLAFLVLKDILIAIIFGLLAAYVFNPVFKRLNKKIPSRSITSFLIIAVLFILISIPAVYLALPLTKQILQTFNQVQQVNFIQPVQEIFPALIDEGLARSLQANINNILGKFFTSLLTELTNLITNIPNLLLQLTVFLFTFFFAMKDSEKLVKYTTDLSPLSKNTEKKFLQEFRGITNAVVFGQVLIGIIQGLMVGLALYLLGVTGSLILTILAVFASIIPVLGSWLVWLPVAVFLFIDGSFFSAIFLVIYGSLIVGTVDNLLRPYFLSKNSHLPLSIGLIGTIGGLYFFGISGLLLGPLILAYVLIVLDFYKQGKLNELLR